MRKHLLKSVLMAVLMVAGAMSAWAYTPALTADKEVAGYKFKAYYNIASENVNGMLPESGDLRYRGSGYGLFNFGSGNRGADITLSVATGDLLIAEFKDTQSRSVTINSISNCTQNTNVTSGDLLAFDVTADAETVNINVGRGGCIIAFLVLEKDADAATATYTLNYYNEEDDAIVKTVSGEVAVGGNVPTDASFFVDDVKYIRVEGEPESFTVAAGENDFTVDVRKANNYNYTLTSNIGVTIATGTGLEGESVTLGYPRYALVDGKFYEAAKNNNEYRTSIALTSNGASATVNYTEKEGANAVFYSEGEAIEGMNVSTANNIPVRASNAQAGVPAGEEDVTITTLPAGKYIFHVGIFTSKSNFYQDSENTIPQVVNIGIGAETFVAGFTNVNLCEVASQEYTLNAETAIKYLVTSWADAQLDYIWIEKTGDVEVATPAEVTFDFAANEWNHALGSGSGDTAEAGNITEPIVKDGVTLTFDQAGASIPARFWTGPQVRIYKDSELTVAAPDGKAITKVEFTANGNNFGLTANPEGLEGATWTGNATSVVFTPTKTNQLTKIVVTLADKNSETTEPAVATIPEVDNIAAFIALESGTEATLKLTDAKVTYAGTNDIVIEDATGAIDLYKMGLTAATNQVLNGTLTGKNSPFQGMPEMAKTGNTDVATVTVIDGEVIEGKAVTVAEAQTADNLLRLVTLTGVEIVAVTEGEDSNAKTTYYAKSGDDQIQIYNKFKADYTIADGDKLAKLTGIIVPYVSGETTIYELAPRTQEDIVAAEQEPETEMITGIADFQELCMQLGKGGPWAVNDGGDAGFTIGDAVMHYLGDYAEQGDAFVWGKRFAYEFVDGRGKFTMRNKNNKKDANCGMFSWDYAHNFSILGLENGDKVTINIGTGTVTFVSTNVSDEVEAGSNVTSGKTYTIVAADGETTRLDINMAKSSLIASITIEKAGQETVPNITDVKPTLALIPGATYQLAANITPADAKLQWKSSDEAVATVAADGTVTAVAAGTATITAFWKSEISDATTDANCEVTVATVDLENAYVATTTYDFAAMADTELTIASEAAGAIWNAANNKNNNVFFCTNEGLQNIAVQAVLSSNKGWSIVNGKGLALAAGAGRCAAVGGIKQGQIVEFFYTGDAFYTSNDDDGVAKKTLNEGIGRAIYQAEADGMIGFEIVVGNAVSKVVVYTDIETAINSVENKNAAALQNEAIYNLSGQKVEKATKGLYIIGGKKVIVK